jgi:transketolase
MMTAGKFKLDNLMCIIDRNFIQIDGGTEEIMPLEPLGDKYRSFNWEVFECDGNDMAAIIETIEKAKAVKGKPTVIVANTVPGKGVSFMEGDYTWHGKPPNKEQAATALHELQAERERLVAHA